VRRAELRSAILSAIARGASLDECVLARSSAIGEGTQKGQAGTTLRILLTEDHAVNQRVALRILERAGHRVAIAENGKAALRMLEEEAFDLVLMDVQMPEMGGFEATALIRARKSARAGTSPSLR
jgi:PleD family two-component response regulator